MYARLLEAQSVRGPKVPGWLTLLVVLNSIFKVLLIGDVSVITVVLKNKRHTLLNIVVLGYKAVK